MIRRSAMPKRAWRSRRSFRICASMVTSSAVVGSSAIRRSGSLASAMAIITRWRWPPESWCGIRVEAPLGLGQPDEVQELQRPRPGRAAAEPLVDEQHLVDLLLDRVERVQRRHRLLEDHRDPVPAHAPERRLVGAQELLALEHDAAGRDAGPSGTAGAGGWTARSRTSRSRSRPRARRSRPARCRARRRGRPAPRRRACRTTPTGRGSPRRGAAAITRSSAGRTRRGRPRR